MNNSVDNPFGTGPKVASVAQATATKKLNTGFGNYGFKMSDYSQPALLAKYAEKEQKLKAMVTAPDPRANVNHSQSTWELDQKGYRGGLATGGLLATQAWASTKKRAAELMAAGDTMEAGEENQYPAEVLDAYNRFRTKEATPEDLKILQSPAYNTVKDWRTQSETRIPIGNETFLARMEKAEKARISAEAKAGNPKLGIPDMFDSHAAVNPVLQERRSREIANWRDGANIHTLRASADGFLENAAVDVTDILGTTAAALTQPRALLQDLAGMAPDLVGGLPTMAAGAALQAGVADNLASRREYIERTGNYAPSESDRLKMAGYVGLNFAANFAENAMVGRAATGGASTPGRVAPSTLKEIAKSTALAPLTVAKDAGKLFASGAAVGYTQGAITSGLGSASGEFSRLEAVESAALEGLLGGAMSVPAGTVKQAVGVGKQAIGAVAEAKTKEFAKRTAEFEQNIDPTNEAYSPAEAISKQAEKFSEEGADKQEIFDRATKARDVAQEHFAGVEKAYKSMVEQVEYAKSLREKAEQQRTDLGDTATPEQLQAIAGMDQFAESIEAQYDKSTRKEIEKAYKAEAETFRSAQTAYQAFHGFNEIQTGTAQNNKTVAEHVETLTKPEATPEQKAQATAHVRSYPMAYKPEQILKFTDDLTNDLTDAQRTTLREFAAESVKAHMNKSIKDVSADLSVGGKGYRKLNDYFTMHSQAKRTNDVFEQNRLKDQFSALASSFAKKAELAKALIKDAQTNPAGFQVIRTEGGAWKVNTGKHLKDDKLRENGGFNIKAGSGKLVTAIAADNAKVQKAHELFTRMTSPDFIGELELDPVEPQAKAEEVAEAVPELEMSEPKVITDVDASNYKEVQATADKKASTARQKSFDDLKAEHVAKKPEVKVEPAEKVEAPEPAPTKLDIQDTPEKATEAPVTEAKVETPVDKPETPEERTEQTSPTTETTVEALPVSKDAEAEGTHVFQEGAATVPALKGVTAAVRKAEKAKDYVKRNIVQAVFKQGSQTKGLTPLVGVESVVETVLKAQDAKEQITEALGTVPDDKQMAHLDTFIGFHETFSAAIDELFQHKEGKNADWKFQDLVQFLVDENGQLPANVKTAITAGAFNWLLQNGSPETAISTDEQILKHLNLPTDQGLTVPSDVRKVMAGVGIRQNPTIASMGANIAKALQFKVDRKADPEYLGRMESSLGALALHALEHTNHVERNDSMTTKDLYSMAVKVLGADIDSVPELSAESGHVKQVFVRVTHGVKDGRLHFPNEQVVEYIQSAKGTQGFLSDLLGVEDAMRRPLLTPPENFLQRTIRKSKSIVPSKAAENSAKAAKDGYSAREPMVKLFSVLHGNAESQLKKMLGIDDSEENLNTFHKDRRENQKAKFSNEWNSLGKALEYMGELEAHRKDGKLPEFYMPINVWSNQRLGYEPNMFNIQTSQIHRAMAGMTAHHAEVTEGAIMEKGKLTTYGVWLKALALGAEDIKDAVDAEGIPKIDLSAASGFKGGKTADKAAGENFLPRFQAYLNREDVQANVDAMVRVLAATDVGKVPDPKDVDMVAAQVAEFGMGAHSLLVLTELAQFKTAKESGKPHTATIGIESDGVTNGPAIANTLAGTLTKALAKQFGLVPKEEDGVEQTLKNYFDIKSNAEMDYYESFGALQLEFINKIMGKDGTSRRGVVAKAMANLAGGFGDRGSAKKWATPFNYSAGYPALKAALARELNANMIKTFEKIAKTAQTDEAKAQQMFDDMVRDVNTAIDYHNKHMQKMNDVTVDTVLGQLGKIEAEYAMLNPEAELFPRPKELNDPVVMAAYLESMGVNVPVKKMTPHTFVDGVNKLVKNHNATMPRASGQVGAVFPNGQELSRMTEFSLTKQQWDALRKVSIGTHGLASEHAIKVAAKDYIQTRDLNIKMNNISFEIYDVLRNAMVEKVLAEKRAAGLIPTRKSGDKEIDMEGLSRDELDKIEKDLLTYAPVLVSAMGAQSDNPIESALFLSKTEKGFDTNGRNEVKSFTYANGKTKTITTGVTTTKEIAPGVRASAMATQAADSRISSNTVAQTPSTNVHDANIAGILNYSKMALIQNTEFFNLMVDYRSQVETFNALLRPINGLAVAVERFGLNEHIQWDNLKNPLGKALPKALLDAGLVSHAEMDKLRLDEMLVKLSDAKFDSEIKKIEFAQSLYAIHQYGGEHGEFVLGKKEHERLAAELKSLKEDKAANREALGATVKKLSEQKQVKQLPKPETEATAFQKGLIDYKGKEIPSDVVLKLLDAELKDGDAVHRELFKVLKKILPEGLKFEYVTDNWVGDKKAAGWFNPKANKISIRAVGSKHNFVKPELFLHEMVHASLVGLTAVAMPHPEVKAAIDRIEALRVEMQKRLPAEFADALVNKEEFMAWGLTNPKFQDALRSTLVSKGERNRKGFMSAFSSFVRDVVGILFKGEKAPKGKEISAIEALLIDSAELMNFIVAENPDRTSTSTQVFPMIRNVDELIQEAKSTSVSDMAQSFDAGNVSGAFQAHLQSVAEGPITRLFDALGKDHLDDLTMPVDYKANDVAAIHGLTEREEYIAELMSVVVENTQDAAAHTSVMRELQRMYDDARERLSPKDFYTGDWNTAAQADKHAAVRKYNHIFRPKVGSGKSGYLANFVGLAMGSEKFNSLLNYTPKREKAADRNMLQKIQDLLNTLVDWSMNALATRSMQSGTNAQRVEKLANRLVKIDIAKRQSTASKFGKVWTATVDFTTNMTGKGSSKVVQMIVDRNLTNSNNRAVSAVAKVTKALMGDKSDQVAELIQAMRDDARPGTRYGELNEIVNEIRTPSDFRAVVEAYLRESVNIQNTRKSWIDITKRSVVEAFSNKGKDLTKEQHAAITYTVLRSDLHGLTDTRNLKEVVQLYKDRNYRNTEITKLANEIKRMSQDGNDMVNRAHDLGHYMATNDAADGLGKNALVIAQGVGTHYMSSKAADPALIKALDDLATLYSLNYMNASYLHEAGKVIDAEMKRKDGNGFEDLMKMHKFLTESASANFKDNPYSITKGYLPEITHTYRETVVARLDEANDLEAQGYVMVGEVPLDPMDTHGKPQALFVLKDGGQQRIVSGAVTFDTTHAKGSVVTDGRRGSVTAEYAKRLESSTRVRARIPSDKYSPAKIQGKRLVPQYDSQGNTIDFHYEMSAATRDTTLVRNNNFGDLLGSYAGNNATTQETSKQNKEVVNALFDEYNTGYTKNPRAYVAIGPNSTDPRLAEIWRLLPYDVKVVVEDSWGKGNPMMVRNELVNVTFGFKKYSVGEMFDKVSKERNFAEKFFVGIIEGLTGIALQPKTKAKLYAVRGERFVQELIKAVKDIIVIRTASVLWGNIKANFLLHLAYGVNPVKAMSDSWLAVRAGLSYKKQRALIIQAEENLRAGIGDASKWEQQVVKAQDIIARNPLLEFIEAGMMPSIVEDVELSSADYTYSTDLQDRFDAQINRVPSSLRTAGKWMMLSHDTPAYKFLAGATQYSDFTAKYVMYKHLTTGTDAMSHAQAIQEASDAFINYDVPTSRGLQYLNDMGLMMFTKFFLRFQRVMFKLMQTRPALVLSQHLATEWLSNTPGVLDPAILGNLGNPLRPSILVAPSAVTDIVTFKTLF